MKMGVRSFQLLTISCLLLTILISTVVCSTCPAYCNCTLSDNSSSLICDKEFLQIWSTFRNCEIKIISLKLVQNESKNEDSIDFDLLKFSAIPKCLQTLDEIDLSDLRVQSWEQSEFLVCNIFSQLNQLSKLNLAFNKIKKFPPRNCSILSSMYPSLIHVNLSYSGISEISIEDTLATFPRLNALDLSYNYKLLLLPEKVKQRNVTFSLKIQGYSGIRIAPSTFPTIPDLRSLDMSYSVRLKSFSSPLFKGFLPNIQRLILRNCTSLNEIEIPNLHHSSHYNNLTYLDVSYCPHLSELDLSDSPKLEILLLTNTPLINLRPPVYSRFLSRSLQVSEQDTYSNSALDFGTSTSWNCSCNILWLTQFLKRKNSKTNTAFCSWPPHLKDTALPIHLDECTPPVIGNCSLTAHRGLRLTEEVIFDCEIEGSPAPDLLWVTPSGEQFVYRRMRQKIYPSFLSIETRQFHSTHRWHNEEEYFSDMDRRRFFILNPNGSLYIDYLTREDPGVYRLYVTNPLGNATRNLTLYLDGSVLYSIRNYSLLSGLFTSSLVLLFGLCTALGRHISRKCSRDEREKRHSLRKLIASIEAYRVTKTDQFRTYRHQHMDRWRGNYNTQKTKLKDLVTSYTVTMQETYYRRISRIRDNCELRVDRLRDSYQAQRARIKDYRSNQVERLRENYQQQTLKIREYAAGQMDRLREHYKLQQQHLTKLLELLSLENCMVGNNIKESDLDLPGMISSEDRLTPLLHRLESLNAVPEEDEFPEELCIVNLSPDELTISVADSDDFVTAASISGDEDISVSSDQLNCTNSLIEKKHNTSQSLGSELDQFASM